MVSPAAVALKGALAEEGGEAGAESKGDEERQGGEYLGETRVDDACVYSCGTQGGRKELESGRKRRRTEPFIAELAADAKR